MPKVISVRGMKGPEDLPPNTVYIGRKVHRKNCNWPQSQWANPYKTRDGSPKERERVLMLHEQWLPQQPELMAALQELRGKDLACWCAPKPCHGDVLLDLANAP